LVRPRPRIDAFDDDPDIVYFYAFRAATAVRLAERVPKPGITLAPFRKKIVDHGKRARGNRSGSSYFPTMICIET
jgi:hypothetical protein